MPSGFSFDTKGFKGAKHLDDKIDRAIGGVCKYWDGKFEAHAKVHAPWTDRTTNARNGLRFVHVKVKKFKHWIIGTHSVEYGIYLEKANDEKYATIMPTIRLMAPRVMGMFVKIMDRLDRAAGGNP